MNSPTVLLVLTAEAVLTNMVSDWITPYGWYSLGAEAVSVLSVSALTPAVIMLDGRLGTAVIQPLMRQIRNLPGQNSGVPLLICTPADSPIIPGANDQLALPLDKAAFLDMLQLWAGPLTDHAYRDMKNPGYRLTRLAGGVRAAALLGNFATSLMEALARIEAGADLKHQAHQIAGMAGTMGYDQLSRAWAAVDRGVDGALEPARRMAQDVLHSLSAQGIGSANA